jgi:cholesterol transport system auxiliary component
MEPRPLIPVVLSIENFRSSPPFHTNRIIYSRDDFSQSRYYYHQWVNPPDEMIPPLLARDFMASNYFRAVILSGHIATGFQMFGTVDKFYEKDTDDQWYAVVGVTITLVDRHISDSADPIRFQASYEKTCPMARKNPESLARAMSQGLSEISAAIIQDIYANLAQDTLR